MVRQAHQKLKIYTKTGDKGETSLFGGKRVSKSSLRIEAIGLVDELNSVIGVAIAEIQNSKFKIQKFKLKIKSELEKVQHDLFEIGSSLANPSTKPYTLNARRLKERVAEFEKLIDQLTAELPELRNFILPGGGETGSQLHLARSICRGAERRIVALAKKEPVEPSILQYFNRLSDLLFTMARFVNHKEKKREIIWKRA